MKIFKKGIAVLMSSLFTLSLPTLATDASAAFNQTVQPTTASVINTADVSSVTKWEYTLKTVSNKNIWSYSKVTLTKGSNTLSTDARKINGTTYVAMRSFINELSGFSVWYNSSTRTLYVSGDGLNMSIKDGSHTVYANERVLYSLTPSVIMTNGRMYVPIDIVAKAISLTVSESGSRASLYGTVRPLKHANSFYDPDAVLWLGRIISAESRGEPMLGQIAVGNVVMNRVDSPLYPNTIWGVIFDKKYGVQFSPVANGTIYNTPTASATEAAKICLEGFRFTDGALFFLQPKLATSSWIPKSREYIFTIGNHEFYR